MPPVAVKTTASPAQTDRSLADRLAAKGWTPTDTASSLEAERQPPAVRPTTRTRSPFDSAWAKVFEPEDCANAPFTWNS